MSYILFLYYKNFCIYGLCHIKCCIHMSIMSVLVPFVMIFLLVFEEFHLCLVGLITLLPLTHIDDYSIAFHFCQYSSHR
uniref:Uncharacterized protein n=1 Tax=Rhizophora mucronata TaxID=61149 RepID=A0A2P2IXK6_RHIMU